jgi:transposase
MTSKKGYELNIGIDWATSKHDVCIEFPDGKRSFDIIKAPPEYIDEWITSLHQKYHGQIAVAVELCKGPIVYALQKYDFVTIFPINPAMLARYRTAFSPSGAKDDPTDAELALDIMLRYPEKIKPLHTQSVEIRKLAFLVEQRRRLVDDKKRYSNRIINTLKQYYPQVLEWFSHRDTQLFSDFLIRWPSLTKIKRTRESTVRAFFNKRGENAVSLLEQRILSINNAIPLTEDEAVVQSHERLITALAQQLQTVIVAIKSFDSAIYELFNGMSDAPIFKSLPGTGPCLAPRLLVAMGKNRDRFESAAEVQTYSGVAPVTERSSKKSWVHWRWQCSKFLRQSFIGKICQPVLLG